MMHTFRLDVAVAAMLSEPRADGHDRVVLWRLPDPRVQHSDGGGYRVYLSAGALRAAAHAEIPVQVMGEISRRELPEGCESPSAASSDRLFCRPIVSWSAP
jgi:hypothetical protein